MKKVFLLAVCSIISAAAAAAQLTIDHTCTTLGAIPASAVAQAKANLHIAYGHTSHGSQLTTGMSGLIGQTGLIGYQGDIYQWNDGGTEGALDLRDAPFSGAEDLANPDFTSWESATRAYLDDHSDVNVVIWSWCGQLSWASTEDVDTYLSLMSGLESDYPDVHFVYMTGHRDIYADAALKQNNQHIRDYCALNDKILYDFADIESYGPDGTYYEFADDACNYYDSEQTLLGNWAQEWQSSHEEGVYWYSCDAAHSEPLNANRKAYAAWWLWARLGGWPGPESGSEFAFTKLPRGGWFEEGDELRLSVGVTGTVGDVEYQWIRDGIDLDGETADEFVIDALALADAGSYGCRVTDEAKLSHETPRVDIQVFAAGDLPAVSAAGIAVIGAGVIAGGLFNFARRRRSRK